MNQIPANEHYPVQSSQRQTAVSRPVDQQSAAEQQAGGHYDQNDANPAARLCENWEKALERLYADSAVLPGSGGIPPYPTLNFIQNGEIRISFQIPNTGQMYSMLAAAKSPLDIQQVVSSAVSAISGCQLAMALDKRYDKDKLSAEISRLKRLLVQAGVKKRDLNREDDLEQRQRKAEKEQRTNEAERLKSELKRKRTARYARESAYASCRLMGPADLLKHPEDAEQVPGLPPESLGEQMLADSVTVGGETSDAVVAVSAPPMEAAPPVSAEASAAPASINVSA